MLSQLSIILFRAVKGVERIEMHDVEPSFHIVVNALNRAVDLAVNFVLAISPELFPGQDLRVFQQKPPEGNKIAVARPGLRPCRSYPLIKLRQSLAGTLDIDALLLSFSCAVFAKAG